MIQLTIIRTLWICNYLSSPQFRRGEKLTACGSSFEFPTTNLFCCLKNTLLAGSCARSGLAQRLLSLVLMFEFELLDEDNIGHDILLASSWLTDIQHTSTKFSFSRSQLLELENENSHRMIRMDRKKHALLLAFNQHTHKQRWICIIHRYISYIYI